MMFNKKSYSRDEVEKIYFSCHSCNYWVQNLINKWIDEQFIELDPNSYIVKKECF